MSRRRHTPTDKSRAEVSALAAYGIKHEEIGRYIGIDDKTLRKYYRDELDIGVIKAHAKVGKFLFNTATGDSLKDGATYSDCVRAAMFYAKTQMCWRETDNINHTSEDGSMTPRETVWKIEIVDAKGKDDEH